MIGEGSSKRADEWKNDPFLGISDERRDSGYDEPEDGDGLWDDVDRASYISYAYSDTSSLPMWAHQELDEDGEVVGSGCK